MGEEGGSEREPGCGRIPYNSPSFRSEVKAKLETEKRRWRFNTIDKLKLDTDAAYEL